MPNKKQDKKYAIKAKEFFSLREQKHELNARLTNLNKQIDVVQRDLLEQMESDDLESCKTEFGSFSRKVEMYPTIKDFDEFFAFVVKTKGKEFLQKRVTIGAVKEFFEENGVYPPGLDAFLKETLNARINPDFRSKLAS